MINFRGYFFEKNRIVMILSLMLSILVSCSLKNEPGVPEKAEQAPANPMEYTVTIRTVKSNVFFMDENVGGLNKSEVLEKIRNYAAIIDIQPQNASLGSSKWSVKHEKAGKIVNVEKTLESLLNAREGETIDPFVEESQPAITAQELSGNIPVIGTYTTVLLDRDPSRVNNIRIAARKINYHKLLPGEVFSFNKTIGRRTQAKGYEDAPIIINTQNGPEKSTGVGGGICQVSTTLYNAIEECGLEVLERHLHSKDVGYVPKGEDATVSYRSADFRFRNNRSYPIMIRTHLKSGTLTVKIIENRNK